MTEGPDATVVRELLSPFMPYLDDPSLYEVIVNRPGQVLTEGSGGWRTHNLPELSFEKLMRLARAVASLSHQSIDETRPILSATLPGNERIQIVIPPATTRNTVSITIRKPSSAALSLGDLEKGGLFTDMAPGSHMAGATDRKLIDLHQTGAWAEFLRQAVLARKNIVISGATGSGKTTLSKALIRHIPDAGHLYRRHAGTRDSSAEPRAVILFQGRSGARQSRREGAPGILSAHAARSNPIAGTARWDGFLLHPQRELWASRLNHNGAR